MWGEQQGVATCEPSGIQRGPSVQRRHWARPAPTRNERVSERRSAAVGSWVGSCASDHERRGPRGRHLHPTDAREVMRNHLRNAVTLSASLTALCLLMHCTAQDRDYALLNIGNPGGGASSGSAGSAADSGTGSGGSAAGNGGNGGDGNGGNGGDGSGALRVTTPTRAYPMQVRTRALSAALAAPVGRTAPSPAGPPRCASRLFPRAGRDPSWSATRMARPAAPAPTRRRSAASMLA